MTKDDNKGLLEVKYNHLNLPVSIKITGDKWIFYTYDAAGNKLEQELKEGADYSKKTSYCGNYIYVDGTLAYILTGEGRLVPKAVGGFDYEYFITDHLGNTRLVVADKNTNGLVDATDIVQETHYEPFGLTLKSLSLDNYTANANKIKFQGQELQDDFDLGWYHFKWRMHSPEIGRFMAIDPLAEKYYYNSTYAFCENKLGLGVELEGLEVSPFYCFTNSFTLNATAYHYSYGNGDGNVGFNDYLGGFLMNYTLVGKTIRTAEAINNYAFNEGDNLFNQGKRYNDAVSSGSDPNQVTFDYTARKINATGQLLSAGNEWLGIVAQQQMTFFSALSTTSLLSKSLSLPENFSKFELNAIKSESRSFFSGPITKIQAQKYMTLSQTRAGKNLLKLTADMPFYPGSQAYNMWMRLSKQWAKGAWGEVHVFQNAEYGVSMQSIWRVGEYPILKTNPNVTNIIFHY